VWWGGGRSGGRGEGEEKGGEGESVECDEERRGVSGE